MAEEKKNIPKLRFREFTGDNANAWELRKLGEVVKVYSGQDYKHLTRGEIPVYGTGGYMTSVNKALSYSEDAVGIGRKGTIDKPYILSSPFWTVDTLFYAIPEEQYNLNFIYAIFKRIPWKKFDESTGVPSLSKKTIANIVISTSNIDEQQKIGNFFRRLDELITLHQRMLDEYKTLKKTMLSKMFPKNGEKYPELRFSGFTDAWELRKLGEIAKITTGKLDANAMDQDGIYDFYTSGIKKYHINSYSFEGPAITIAGNGATVGYMHLADGKFDAYQRTYVLTDFDGNRQYLFENIGLKLPKKIKQESRTGSIPYIVLDMLTKLLIDYPSINEQQKIGSFFRHLDELITLHQRELDLLKTLKKTMLQQMFV